MEALGFGGGMHIQGGCCGESCRVVRVVGGGGSVRGVVVVVVWWWRFGGWGGLWWVGAGHRLHRARGHASAWGEVCEACGEGARGVHHPEI